MGLFNKSNSINEYRILEEYSLFLDKLLLSDDYISKKDYKSTEELKKAYSKLLTLETERVLVQWCKQNRTDYKKISYLMSKYLNAKILVDKHNNEYVKKHLNLDKEYLDNILIKDDPNIKLDLEQRTVVLSDEDYTLVIAGAGAGKTTTIEAKVKYLVDKKGINPDRVLIVSFTRKATEELKERFNRLEIPVNISTFHSIGNTIIKENDGERHRVVETGFMYKVIEEWLTSQLDDEYFIKKILLFFASYLTIPFDEDKISMLYKTLAANDNVTIRGDLLDALDEYNKTQTKEKLTINDERVRSVDECRIANFLFVKGLNYEYEPVYQHGFDDTTKPYCPDFLIKYNGQNIYLEHFGISQSGENNRFTPKQLEEYKKHINDKIKLHRKHHTKLIYTFSKYDDGRDLITHLEEELKKAGIEFNTKKDVEIYKTIAKKAQDKYFNKFILLVCNFINRFKVDNYDPATKFDEWLYLIKNERTKLFVEIVKRCFYIYESKRLELKAVDFEDMINNAVNVLDQKIKNHDMLPYDYIFVDEYQDISLQRFDLCEKLSKASNAKIVAVGDDWQSIFRFSGAQIDLFTKFEEKMGYANILKITKTYRNSQELIDVAGGFVMKNQKQIKKDLKSNKSIKDPVILMSYDDSYDKDDKKHGPFYRLGEAVEKALDDIVAKNGLNKSVLFIGRYNYEGKNLAQLEEFFFFENDKLKSKKYPQLDISFMTAHASKGLGRDNVVIINGKDDVLGFPSKIEDDPVMKLVIKNDEEIDFEEERRLFYVALTRTKNRVYIIAPQQRPSKFILEIQKNFTQVILRGVELNPIENNKYKYICPVCGYPLQKRQSKFKFMNATKKLWICSNDPEVCGFLTNDLGGNKYKMSISKCPDCIDGYLIVKPVKNSDERILGCTNYKKDGSGCNFSMLSYNYTQDKNKINCIVDSTNEELELAIIKILEVANGIKTKKVDFKFNYKQLCHFLVGEKDDIFNYFNLDENENYGCLKKKGYSYCSKLIDALLELKLLGKEIKDNKFENMVVKKQTFSKESIRMIKELIN